MEGFKMPMVLTQVYLDAPQKKALASQAKRAGRSVSDLMRDAVDAAILGVTSEDIKTLDEGTKKAKSDIDAMLGDLRQNTKEHKEFMREIQRLRKTSK
jgi:Ribbon-helix-helix protein, copG family